MTGRSVTASFDVPWQMIEWNVHERLLPRRTASARARLRFWLLDYRSLGEYDPASCTGGFFKETVVAFPARYGADPTEATTYIWTDSDEYLTWGRELFGWPAARGEIDLRGGFWTDGVLKGARGEATCRTGVGMTSISSFRIDGPASVPTNRTPSFVTMRRLIHAGHDEVSIEAVLVRMRILDWGKHYDATGKVRFEFGKEHPLHGLKPENVTLRAVDGVEMVVGDDVSWRSVERGVWRGESGRVS